MDHKNAISILLVTTEYLRVEFSKTLNKILTVIGKHRQVFMHMNVKVGSLFMKIGLIRKYTYEH